MPAIQLVKTDKYEHNARTFKKIFLDKDRNGNPIIYEDIPDDIASYLVLTGNFRFVKTQKEDVPESEKRIDIVKRALADGIIDASGRKVVTRKEPDIIQKILDIEMDEKGNTVFKEKQTTSGESYLKNLNSSDTGVITSTKVGRRRGKST